LCKHAGKDTIIIIVHFLKHIIVGKSEGTGKEGDEEEDVSSYCRNQRLMGTERGSTRSNFVENSI